MADIIITDQNISKRIEKRVRQILGEIGEEESGYYNIITTLMLSVECKAIAIKYNCYIQSWMTIDDGVAECYNASTKNKEDPETYGLISAPTETQAIIVAFMWLSDRQNFVSEAHKIITDNVG